MQGQFPRLVHGGVWSFIFLNVRRGGRWNRKKIPKPKSRKAEKPKSRKTKLAIRNGRWCQTRGEVLFRTRTVSVGTAFGVDARMEQRAPVLTRPRGDVSGCGAVAFSTGLIPVRFVFHPRGPFHAHVTAIVHKIHRSAFGVLACAHRVGTSRPK